MNKRMRSALLAAITIAIPAEGLRQYAYHDPAGILTVCYGSTTNVINGRLYSLDECKALLTDEMQEAIEHVEACVPGLPAEVLAAFADATYNVGPRIACDLERSRAARLLATGRLTAACEELPRWNKARVMGQLVELPGLTTRRQRERALCLIGAAND